MKHLDNTICALSTAPGRAGIAVVRLSGPEALAIAGRLFTPRRSADWPPPPRHAVLGAVRDPRDTSKAELDEVLLTCFPAPHSYTGEDVAEISLHGSPVLVDALLDALLACGARLAEPGEFTLRAFLRGRMDLVQAEAVRDVIEARTLYQAQVAARQRTGELSRRLQPLKRAVVDIVVELESAVEFVEDDLPAISRAAAANRLAAVSEELERWIGSYRRGRVVREGFSLAVVGRPNVGKSSLFNALLAEERSIVTEVAGTTRDSIAELTNLEGIPVRLIDTAGVREAADRIEQLGVDRSYSAIADADALLLVVDGSVPPAAEDVVVRDRLTGLSWILVSNKSDLGPVWSAEQKMDFAGGRPAVEVSALTSAGIDALRTAILVHLFGDAAGSRDGLLVTNLRHCQVIEAARAALGRAGQALRVGLSEEFALFDLHAALANLGEVTGETTVEDLLDQIFSRFCIGK